MKTRVAFRTVLGLLSALALPLKCQAAGTTVATYTPAGFHMGVDQFGTRGMIGSERFTVRVNHSNPPSGLFATCEKVREVSISSRANAGAGGLPTPLTKKAIQPPMCSFDVTLTGSLAPETLEAVTRACAFKAGTTATVSRTLEAALTYNNGSIDIVQSNVSIEVTCFPTCPPVSFATAETLPTASKGVPYSLLLQVSGGGPGWRVFRIDRGSLPPGLSLSSDGSISGTPLTPGTYVFQLEVRDSCGYAWQSTTKAFVIEVRFIERERLELQRRRPR